MTIVIMEGKIIPQFPKYTITKDGRVYSHFVHRFLKLQKRGAHLVISVRDAEGLVKNITVHRLVAIAYLPNPEKHPYVVHKNSDTFDNRVENLEWGPNNNKHRKQGDFRKKVYQYDTEGTLLKVFDSASSAAEYLGCSKSSIRACCAERKTCRGYIFKYPKEDRAKQKVDINEEIWKTIGEAPKYRVSNFGRVHNSKNRIMRQNTADLYNSVTLRVKPNEKKTFRTHIVVAKAFLPNPKNFPVVDHIDGNKRNNHVNNLEWCTYQENAQRAINFGLTPAKSAVVQYSVTGEKIREWGSIKEAGENTPAHPVSISNCCLRRCKSSGGFIWRYKGDELEEDFPQPGLPREVWQYSLDGMLIKNWSSLSEAAQKTNVSNANIVKACKGKYKTAGGFVWRYKDQPVTQKEIAQIPSKKCKKVNQLTKDGKFIKTWDKIKDAADELSIHSSSISAVCAKRKGFNSAGGFKWEYA